MGCSLRHVGILDFSMQCHIHMHIAATKFNIAHVAKKESTTSKRAPNQTRIIECNVVPKPSCGSLEISTSRKEKKNAKKGN
jgi:hypothetical protein